MDLEHRIARLSPAKLALLERRLKKTSAGNSRPSSLPTAPRQKDVRLSFSQERLWFLDQMEPESAAYNLPTIIRVSGPANPRLVEGAIRQVVARHSALRTRFVVRDDHPCQVIADDVGEGFDFATIDFRGPAAPSSPSVRQTINREIWTPFNLATGPLLRARLILLGNQEQVLLVVVHHIVSDGWSLDIFTREFRLAYEAAMRGVAADLGQPPRQYVDYSLFQREELEGEKLASLLSYWRQQLADAPSLLALPVDHTRPLKQSFNGALYPFTIPAAATRALRSLCHECGVVPFMVFLAAFKVLLFRYTAQSKIIVGTPIANRSRSEFESVIGLFANTLVLCSAMTPRMTFRELLTQVRETTLGAYEYQDLPFERLVADLQPERSLSYNPLFQVMFTFQNAQADRGQARGGDRHVDAGDDGLALDVQFSKFDLTLAISEAHDAMSAVFEYAADLFDRDTIGRMAGHYLNILAHVLGSPDEAITAFSFLSPEEKRLIVDEWNQTGRTWAEELPLHRRFERWAEATPDATAVTFENSSLTYAELDRRSAHVAALLRGRGVARGSIVGICLPRSLEMVTGLLGILKVGAAYMPIEPDFPAERAAYMLADASVREVLTTADCAPLLAPHDVHTIVLDAIRWDTAGGTLPRADDLSPADLAYVLFTSGSTGQPKGVMVSHGAIFNRLEWTQERYQLTPADRVMQKTPFTFDVSVWEFFWTLSAGACLVVAEPERHKEALYLVDLIRKQRVTCLHFVPSMLQLFLHEDLTSCESLRLIICSGEALTVDQCRRLQALEGVSAHNLYGPTEAAVDVTHWDCADWRDQYLSVPIGRPISNTQIYILNEALQPAPIGVAGELYIGGRNLADGYLNKPELTARQFVPNPFSADGSSRLYRTGDLARFRGDGVIEYIGRSDSQVKLRGLRIELAEIESLLRQYPGIAEAVVVVHRYADQDERLAAYVVLDRPDEVADAAAISAFLARKLPHYMVPATIMPIPAVPLTANGKLNRKALPEPTPARTAAAPLPPATEVERELIDIWRRFLKLDHVEASDDFFDLGGHSILATQVINSINRHYFLNVPVRLLFENPTVKTLAAALSAFEDEVWLDESKHATAILTRSKRRVLHSASELSEEQIDDFLVQHFEELDIARFENVGALVTWSRGYAPPAAAVPTGNGHRATTSGNGDASPGDYFQSYLALARTRAELESLALRAYRLPPPASAGNGHDDPIAQLREGGMRIFASYAEDVRQRLSDHTNRLIAPADLCAYCLQLIRMADLAASITVLSVPRHDAAPNRTER